MATREEIREGIEDILSALYSFHLDGDAYAKQIIEYLDSQGVVRKVDSHDLLAGKTYDTGYFEPLI